MDFLNSLYGRPNTLKTQSSLYRRWIKPYEDLDLSEDQNLLTIIRIWEKKGLSNQTIKSLLLLLKKYHEWKTGEIIQTRKYIRLVQRKEQTTKVKAPTKEQARSIIHHLDGEMKLIVMLAYYAGLRKGEIFGLKRKDIDLDRNVIFVQRSYNGPTKNGKSRAVPIAKELKETLDIYTDSEYIIPFFIEIGPLIKKICQLYGYPEFTLHSFRHGFATLALDAGRSIKQVSETLGHSSVSITIDQYWSNIKGDIELGFC